MAPYYIFLAILKGIKGNTKKKKKKEAENNWSDFLSASSVKTLIPGLRNTDDSVAFAF